jgi:hypothetical protein
LTGSCSQRTIVKVLSFCLVWVLIDAIISPLAASTRGSSENTARLCQRLRARWRRPVALAEAGRFRLVGPTWRRARVG